MKKETVTPIVVPMAFEWSPEMKEIARQIRDPQDLNEALLSVKADKAAKRIGVEIAAAIQRTAIESMIGKQK